MKKPKTIKPKAANAGASHGVTRELLMKAARMLESASSWVIFSHAKLDGDAVGSSTALYEAGVIQGKRVRWVGVDPVPPNYRFLSHTGEYITQKKYKFDSADDLYVFLDSANEERGIDGLKERSPGAAILNIDHHEDNTKFGTFNCVDSETSATSEILWRIMTEANWPITQQIAESLYAGMVADCGWFAFSNTSPATHLMAADLLSKGVDPTKINSCVSHNRSMEGVRLWGLAFLRVFRWGPSSQFAMTWLTRRDFAVANAIPSDTAMLVNQMLMIQGVRFAVLLTEDGPRHVKGNFRSKDGTVPAAAAARALGGGGHPKAAGANISLSMAYAIQAVQETVDKAYAEWNSADR